MAQLAQNRRHKSTLKDLGDFTTTIRVVPIMLMAIVIGAIGAYVAWFLLKLIGLFTNIFYYQRLSTGFASPVGNQLGVYAIAVPVVGSLIVGFMARYGSEQIRGHGIPEAIESILMNGSRIRPRLAILKPLSAAISIGSGGPFGAEGPIIMTGGAFGSIFAQLFHFTSMERRTLLVAGAAAGMSATFAAPLSSVLIGVELLLFEWKPRSAIPVALASATACAVRRYLLGLGPLFPVPPHPGLHRSGGPWRVRRSGDCRRGPVSATDARGLRSRGSFQTAANSLDVVAGDRRRVRRIRRIHFPASPWRGIRHNRKAPAGKCPAQHLCGSSVS